MYSCQNTGKKVYLPALQLGLWHLYFNFWTLEVILRRFEVRLPRYGRKQLLPGFEIVFTAFTILIFRIFEVILRQLDVLLPKYRQKSLFTGFAIGFMTFVFQFLNIGGYFASIWGAVAKVWAKTIITWLWNCVYGIHCSIFRTLEVILCLFVVRLARYRQ